MADADQNPVFPDEQFIITKAKIETNKQDMKPKKKYSDEKMMNLTEDFKSMLASTITSFMDQIKISKSFPAHKDSTKPQYPTIVVIVNRMAPPLDSGDSTKIGGMWNLKHDISSPEFYELLIKTELKWDTALDPNNFYNNMKMCLNDVNRPQEDLLPDYLYIKIHFHFK